MSKASGAGLPPMKQGEDFHDYMRRCYQQQAPGAWAKDNNCNHVQSRLPGPIYRQFYAFLKGRNWSASTGVQYAITQLLLKEHA